MLRYTFEPQRRQNHVCKTIQQSQYPHRQHPLMVISVCVCLSVDSFFFFYQKKSKSLDKRVFYKCCCFRLRRLYTQGATDSQATADSPELHRIWLQQMWAHALLLRLPAWLTESGCTSCDRKNETKKVFAFSSHCTLSRCCLLCCFFRGLMISFLYSAASNIAQLTGSIARHSLQDHSTLRFDIEWKLFRENGVCHFN